MTVLVCTWDAGTCHKLEPWEWNEIQCIAMHIVYHIVGFLIVHIDVLVGKYSIACLCSRKHVSVGHLGMKGMQGCKGMQGM